MAIIKLGTTVIGIRGTVAGVTYSANKAGPHAKGWTRSANPRTTGQSAQRGKTANWASSWRSLTPAQQTAWNAYGAAAGQQKFNSLGIGYYASGFSWYVACNTNLQRTGDPTISAAPVLATPVAPVLNFMLARTTGTPGTSNVQRTNLVPCTGLRVIVQSFMANSTGRSVANPKTFLVASPLSDADFRTYFTTQMPALYGTIVLGQKLFLRCCFQNLEGRRGPWATISNATQNT